MTRIKPYHELKFLINFKQMLEIETCLQSFCRHDPNGDNGLYDVMSLYYDTPDLQFFRDKVEGEFSKKKVRLRVYRLKNSTWQNAALEIKRRDGNLVTKARHKPNKFSLESECKDLIDLLARQNKMLKPAATVFYRRKAWFCPEIHGLRFTFDQNLALLSPDVFSSGNDFAFDLPAKMQKLPIVFEIKSYAGAPQAILQLLQKIAVAQVSFSKYAQAIEKQPIKGY